MLLPILYIPYSLVNKVLVFEIFGCPCDNPNFNANNITNIFWILVSIVTPFLIIINYIKDFNLMGRRKIVLFMVNLVLIAAYSVLLAIVFARSMHFR